MRERGRKGIDCVHGGAETIEMRFIFWQNLISPHQAPLMDRLAAHGNEVIIVSAEALSHERRSMGWTNPELNACKVIIDPSENELRALCRDATPDTLHVIAGARGTALGRQAAKLLAFYNVKYAIISEAPDPRGLYGFLRWVKYSVERLRIGKRVRFILAMGQIGERWFRSCGYSREIIFPFSYIVDVPSAGLNTDTELEILYVGRLIKLKGVDLLLAAIAKLPNCRLAIVGDGPEKAKLQAFARDLGIGARIEWKGSVPSAQAIAYIGRSKVLVLPSRKDGWGAVVNEALMVGTPVVCSSACGAADLVKHSGFGSVFTSGEVPELTEKLRDVLRLSQQIGVREDIREWSQSIRPEALAIYFEEVVEHIHSNAVRPEAPWRTNG